MVWHSRTHAKRTFNYDSEAYAKLQLEVTRVAPEMPLLRSARTVLVGYARVIMLKPDRRIMYELNRIQDIREAIALWMFNEDGDNSFIVLNVGPTSVDGILRSMRVYEEQVPWV